MGDVLNGEFVRQNFGRNLLSLPICMIMGLTKSLHPRGVD